MSKDDSAIGELAFERLCSNFVNDHVGSAMARKLDYHGRAGCPDHLFIIEGVVCFVEFKRPGVGKLSPLQTAEFEVYRECRKPVEIVRTPQDFYAKVLVHAREGQTLFREFLNRWKGIQEKAVRLRGRLGVRGGMKNA